MKKLSKKGIIGISSGVAVTAIAVIAVIILTSSAAAFGSLEILSGGSAPSFRDGSVDKALFNQPTGLLAVSNGIVVGDSGNGLLRGIIEDKEVTTVSGNITALNGFGRNIGGYADGPADEAIIGSVGYLCEYDKKIVFTDPANYAIRTSSEEGVSTLTTGSLIEGYADKFTKVIGDNIYTSSFGAPTGITVDAGGNYYVTDKSNHTVVLVDKDGNCKLFAGVPGEAGYKDGDAKSALFCDPTGILYVDGALYVADSGNNLIRKIENGKVSTFAGGIDGYDEVSGRAKGGNSVGSKTRFFNPNGLAYYDGIMFVADSGNNCIKAILPNGDSLLAFGSSFGLKVGTGEDALLNYPTDVIVSDGCLYVADYGNNAIRKATIDSAKLKDETVKQNTQEDLKARQVVITNIIVGDEKENISYVLRGSTKTAVYAGMRLTAGDVIVAESGNAVIMTIDSDKTFRLEPCSEMRIDTVNSKQMSLSLVSGAYLFLVENKLSDNEHMDFTAGGTTMSIRGTDGYVSNLINTGTTSQMQSEIKSAGSAASNNSDLMLNSNRPLLEININIPPVQQPEGTPRTADLSGPGADTLFGLNSGSALLTDGTTSTMIYPGQIANSNPSGITISGGIANDTDLINNPEPITDVSNPPPPEPKPYHQHIWYVNEDKSKEPTCTEDGYYYYECACEINPCGETYTEILKAGHTLVHHDGLEATCLESGYKEYDTCSKCNYSTYEKIEALGHDIEHHNAQAATCVSIGWNAYDTCSRCNYSTYEEIPALGHELVHHDAQAPTCTDVGWKAYDSCARCNYSTYEEIPALGHELVHHDAKDATCTEAGYKAYDTCSNCDYSTFEEVPALNHELTHHEAQAATCTENGWDAYDTCSKCDYTTYVEKPALNHDLTHHEAQAATCTGIGWDAYDTCSRCDYTTYVEKPALDHNLVHHEAQAATCTEIGWDAYDTCSRCDYTTYEAIQAIGHTTALMPEVVPTCEEDGNYAYYYCSVCQKYFADKSGSKELSYDEDIFRAKLGHNLEFVDAVDPTCEEDGNNEYYYCSVCKKYFADELGTEELSYNENILIEKTGHELEFVEAVAATCEDEGNNAYYFCSVCKGYYADKDGTQKLSYENDVILPALGHEMKYYPANDPTCDTDGNNEYYYCSVCQQYFADREGNESLSYDEDILVDKLGHDLDYFEAVEPSCDEAGNTEYFQCSVCEKYFADENAYTELTYETDIYLKALGHKMKFVDAVDPTCETAGNNAYYYCSVCQGYFSDIDGTVVLSYEEDIYLDALGHSMEYFDAVDPTCDTDGNNEYYYCSVCQQYFADEDGTESLSYDEDIILPALGHELELFEAAEATCEEDGNIDYYYCSVCERYFADEDGTTELSYENDVIVPALGHQTKYYSANDPTCDEEGNYEYYYCSVCQQYFADKDGTDALSYDEDIYREALGHNLEYFEAVEPTCDTDGNNEYYYCSVCHRYFADEDGSEELSYDENILVEKTGHNLEFTEAVEATCEEDGNTDYYYCSVCERYFADELGTQELSYEENIVLPALGHQMKYYPANDPTCVDSGNNEYYYCSACQRYFDDRTGSNELTYETDIFIPANGHDLDYFDANEPTCDAAGNNEYFLCSVCGKYYANEDATTELSYENDIYLAALGHNLKNIKAVEPTCEDEGNYACYYCSVCETYFSDVNCTTILDYEESIYRAPLGHDFEYFDAVDPTCDTDGNNEYYYCSVCQQYFADEDGTESLSYDEDIILPALGHELELFEAAEATCEEDGNIDYYYCSVCERYFADEDGTTELSYENDVIVPALGHQMKYYPANDPTCDEDGNNEYYYCSVCQQYFSDREGSESMSYDEEIILPAFGHDMEFVEASEATCEEDGNLAYYYCPVCERYFADDLGTTELSYENDIVFKSAGHQMHFNVAHDATCEADGNAEYYYCSACQQYFADEEGTELLSYDVDIFIQRLGHEIEFVAAVAPTCDTDGNYDYFHCTTCGKYFADEFASSELVYESDVYRAALGHHMEFNEAVDPTCTDSGNNAYYYCSVCQGYFSDSNGENALSYDDNVYLAALGHQMKYYPANDPTCVDPGNEAYYYCSVCQRYFDDRTGSNVLSYEKDIYIPANGHDLDYFDANEPTCDAAGNNEYFLCSVCEKYYANEDASTELSYENDIYLAALGHNLKHIEAVEPTCEGEGNYACYYCSVCQTYFSDVNCTTVLDYQRSVYRAPLGHNLEYVEFVEPTCTADGNNEYYYCSVCHRYFDNEDAETELSYADDIFLAKLEHMMDFFEEVEPTCEAEGSYAYYCCSNCDCCFADEDGTQELSYEDDIYRAPHSATLEYDEGFDPCCEEDGRKPCYYCTECFAEFFDDKALHPVHDGDLDIDALGHHLVFVEGQEPTCGEDGFIEHYECTNDDCGQLFYDADGEDPIYEDAELLLEPTFEHDMDYLYIPDSEETMPTVQDLLDFENKEVILSGEGLNDSGSFTVYLVSNRCMVCGQLESQDVVVLINHTDGTFMEKLEAEPELLDDSNMQLAVHDFDIYEYNFSDALYSVLIDFIYMNDEPTLKLYRISEGCPEYFKTAAEAAADQESHVNAFWYESGAVYECGCFRMF